jgi:zinc transport system substrate-binding protein
MAIGPMRPTRFFFVTIALCLAAQARGEALVVYAVNYPLAWFAERIGGDEVDVRFPVPAGEDPAFWEPSPDDIVAFHDADLILLNGAGYAKWTAHASLPRRKLVNTSLSLEDRLMRVDGEAIHSHGPGGDHSHAGVAFTTWLDPTQAIAQARSIGQAMTDAMPASSDAFTTGVARLESELEELDAELAGAFAALRDESMLASHPVYQYLARRYELDLSALVWEPGAMPDESDWEALEALLKERPSRFMLWEAEPLLATRERLQVLGILPIVFRPAMNRPEDSDFLSVMRANVESVRRAAGPAR